MKYFNYKFKSSKLKNAKRIIIIRILLLFSGLLCFSAYSSAQNKQLNIQANNMSIKDIFKSIESQTDYTFTYNDTQIDVNQKVTGNYRNADVTNVLDQVLKGTGIAYKIQGQRIILTPEPAKNGAKTQQGLRVSGAVVDNNGEQLPGVSVILKGSTEGTVTGANGEFDITVPSDASVLQFQFMGFKTQEVKVGNQQMINVSMQEDMQALKEVVVVGFGTQRKVDLTGSVGVATAKDLDSRPVQNAVQALQGIVPGLNIVQNQGQTDISSSPTINIRGTGTIGQGSNAAPLILIDGMEGDITAINPQDIESISVLKDAAASAIYGSRAPFGVILVTTKHGKSGKVTVNYNNAFKWSSPQHLPQPMDSYNFALYVNAAQENAGAGPYFDAAWLQRIQDFQAGKLINPANGLPMTSIAIGNRWGDYDGGNDNVDWYKAVYKSSVPSEEHNLSVSGGNETTQYYVSGNFLDQSGLMRFGDNHFNRYAATGKITTKFAPWGTLSYSTRWIRENYVRPTQMNGDLFQDLGRQGWPLLPLYDPNGYLMSAPSYALPLRDGGSTNQQSDWLYQQASLVIEPIKGWKTTGELNYRTQYDLYHMDWQETYNHDINSNPVPYSTYTGVQEGSDNANYLNPNLYSEYSKTINDNYFKVLVGVQSEFYNYRNIGALQQGIIVPSLPTINTSSGMDATGVAQPPVVGGGYDKWANIGFFGRLNYNYKERYLFEANLRYDGTSRFRQDHRWVASPSVSVGWNIAQESFWKPLENTIGEFKLRASIGNLANQNTSGYYPTYVQLPLGTGNSNFLINGTRTSTAWMPSLVSTSLTWEQVQTWNVGADLALLKNRLTASFDVYTRYTNNMVGPGVDLPVTLGTGVPVTNNTDMKTNGFEVQIGWSDRLSNGFAYSIKASLANSKSIVTKYPNPTGSLSTYYDGEKLGEIWGYSTMGIAKTDQEMQDHLATLPNGGQNALGSNWKAGDIMYADLNGDGKIDWGAWTLTDHGDCKIIGNSSPQFPVGLDLNASWKGLDIRAFFQGILKRDYFANSYFFWGAYSWGMWWSSALVPQENYFRGDPNDPMGQNLNAYYPRPIYGDGKNQQTQTRYLLNAAYLRLKNLQLGYTLPATWTEKAGIQKLRFYLSGENILTFTKMPAMFDPETIDGGTSNSGATAGNGYPLSKVFAFGLSLTF